MFPELLRAGAQLAQQPQASPAQTQEMQPNTDSDEGDNVDLVPQDPYDQYPHNLHQRAMVHLQNAKQLFSQQAAQKMPAAKRSKVGLGIALASILGSALDPTRQAGSAFFNSYRNAQAQDDAASNQQAMQNFQQRQNQLGVQGNQESQAAAMLNQQGNDAQDAIDQQGVQDESRRRFDLGRQDRLDAQSRADDAKDKSSFEAEFNGFKTSAGSAHPLIRKIGAMGMRAHLMKSADKLEGWGYNPQDLHDMTNEVEKSGEQLDAQQKTEAKMKMKAAETADMQKRQKINQNAKIYPLLVKQKDKQIEAMDAKGKVTAEQVKLLKERYKDMHEIQPLKVAEAQSAVIKSHLAIEKMGKGKATPDDLKNLTAYGRSVAQGVSMYQKEINLQNGIIKNQSVLAKTGDVKAAKAIGDAQAKISDLEKSHSYLIQQSDKIREKLKKRL